MGTNKYVLDNENRLKTVCPNHHKMMDSLMEYRSPLAEHLPEAGEPLGSPITERVVIEFVLCALTFLIARLVPGRKH